MTMRSMWAITATVVALTALAALRSAFAPQASAAPQAAAPASGLPDTTIADRAPWGYSGASTPQGRAPVQPIPFPHPTHVQTLGMNCLYCHFSANKSPDPGLPAVGTCIGCHQIVGPNRPAMNGRPARTSAGIQTLIDYWKKKQPIPWQRIHKVPDYVNFPHMRHVNAGVTCQTCHGPVQNMTRVFQWSSLSMGWCVNCHVGRVNPAWHAAYDCATCHY
jgi:Cytochrome c7 and related cytochrome c